MTQQVNIKLNLPVVYHPSACEPEYEQIRRSWSERLFTWPWKPRQRYKEVMKELNPQIYVRRNERGLMFVLAHPSLRPQIEALKKQVADTNVLASLGRS